MKHTFVAYIECLSPSLDTFLPGKKQVLHRIYLIEVPRSTLIYVIADKEVLSCSLLDGEEERGSDACEAVSLKIIQQTAYCSLRLIFEGTSLKTFVKLLKRNLKKDLPCTR